MAFAILSGQGSLGWYGNLPALMIVVLGGLASALVAFPMRRVLTAVGLMGRAVVSEVADPEPLVALLVTLNRKARREGLLSLEEELTHLPSEFLARGLRLVIDGADPQTLREILENEIRAMQDRHQAGKAVVDHLARSSPGFGLIGTLIGLIIMFRNLGDHPERIGIGMSLALLTTMYGCVFAYLVFGPTARKLGARSEAETLTRMMMLEGIISIQGGENPMILEERLRVFLPPRARDRASAQVVSGGGAGPTSVL
jgi:chemotaxis protein MotA